MTAPSFDNANNMSQGDRKFSRMTDKLIMEEDSTFGVPATPKKSDLHNNHKKSMDMLRNDILCL